MPVRRVARSLAFALVCALAINVASPASAIVGGSDVTGDEGRFVVLLSNGCTGSLIAPTWVLTAATCVVGENGASTWRAGDGVYTGVRAGDHLITTSFTVATRVMAHPEFSWERSNSYRNVGLIELSKPVTAPTVALLGAGELDRTTSEEPGVIFGWGTVAPYLPGRGSFVAPDTLQRSAVSISWWNLPFYLSLESTSDVTPCYGDNGGPLVVETTQGLALAGVLSSFQTGCPLGSLSLNGYARVTALLPWITATVSGETVLADVAPGGVSLVTPARLVDTRLGRGGAAGTAATVELDVAASAPPGATALVGNITAVGPVGANASIGRCGRMVQSSSTVVGAGTASASLAIVPLGPDRRLCLTRSHDVVLDVTGWVGPGGALLSANEPRRALDTRIGHGARMGPLRPFEPLAVRLDGRPAGATGAVVNVTAIAGAGDVYVTAYPCGGPVPPTSTLNAAAGTTVPNTALLPMAADGSVCLVSNGSPHVVVDVNAWMGPDGQSLVIGDTWDGVSGQAYFAKQDSERSVVGWGGVPDGAGIAVVSLSITALEDSYLTLYPCDRPRPTTSVANFRSWVPVKLTTLVAVGPSGDVCAYSDSTMSLDFDFVGWSQ